MEKKIYVPTMEELYAMQEEGANVYKYLTVKAIEALIVEGINDPNKGMLKSAYKYFQEDEAIASAICRLYPEELQYSKIAKYNVDLCLYLIRNTHDQTIYQLDRLANFNTNTQSNYTVEREVINILDRNLPDTPQYRFEYMKSQLLERIFSTNFITDDFCSEGMLRQLSSIEPAYVIKHANITGKRADRELLNSSIRNYANRYGLAWDLHEDSEGKDILTNQDTQVKRLIKCINHNKDNLYKTTTRK